MKDTLIKYNYKFLGVVILSSVISVFLSFFRIYKAETPLYSFLMWNLFLAWIPFIISFIYIIFQKKVNNRLFDFTMFSSWLLFYPNAPYILTDVIHLVDLRDHVPIWYDLMLILSFAWSGLIVGIVSLSNIHSALKNIMNNVQSWSVIFLSIVLGSFGVYLGRFQRWNSWDIVTQPLGLFKGIFQKMLEPGADYTSIGVTGLFTLFLTITYLTFYSFKNEKNII